MEKKITDPNEVNLAEYQRALDLDYRTDGLTLPNPPTFQDPEVDKASANLREAILNPNTKPDTVIDPDGTTLQEYRDRINLGKLPKGSTKEAREAAGKHEIKVKTVDGKKVVVVTAPEASSVESAIGDTDYVGKTVEVVEHPLVAEMKEDKK